MRPPPLDPRLPALKQQWAATGTHSVGLRTQYQINVGPALRPIVGSIPVKRIRRWPNIETE